MGRKSLAKERRRQILDAYEECILESGFAATTLGDVAERAGCKRQLIRHYFGNREAVVRDLLSRLAGRYDRRIEERIVGTTPVEVLDSFLESIANTVGDEEDKRDDRLFGELFGAALTDPPLRAELQRTTERWLAEHVEFLRWLAPDAPDEEIDATAKLCLGLNFGAGTLRTLGVIDDDPSWLCGSLRRAIDRLRDHRDGTDPSPRVATGEPDAPEST